MLRRRSAITVRCGVPTPKRATTSESDVACLPAGRTPISLYSGSGIHGSLYGSSWAPSCHRSETAAPPGHFVHLLSIPAAPTLTHQPHPASKRLICCSRSIHLLLGDGASIFA